MSHASRFVPALAATGVLVLAGCGSSAVHLNPAPDADNPDCARAMVAMPEELAGMVQRETTAQATTAWGDPAEVIVTCGVQVQEPVSDPCASVNGVDWILKPTDSAEAKNTEAKGTWAATTYGRSPNLQITFNADKVSSSSLLIDLNSAVAQLPQVKKCQNVDDTLSL
ncbi:DUF3515 family protein [Rothia sp. LK2588]|uniref:DUF3515 family protein n=1 Tax=Rothia sp. LK2588 TaxID=3114369 RepID=UPI0034CE7489